MNDDVTLDLVSDYLVEEESGNPTIENAIVEKPAFTSAAVPQPKIDLESLKAEDNSGRSEALNETRDQLGEIQHEKLQQEFDSARKLGRNILGAIQQRQEGRLTTIHDLRRIDPAYVKAINSRDSISEEDIRNAQRASLGIGIEISAQEKSFRLPPNSPIRENAQSLDTLATLSRQGGQYTEQLTSDGLEAMVLDEGRKAYAKWHGGEAMAASLTDQEIISWVNEQFHGADIRLRQMAEKVRTAYHR